MRRKKILISVLISLAVVISACPLIYFAPKSVSFYLLAFKPTSIEIEIYDYHNSDINLISYDVDSDSVSDCFKEIKEYVIKPSLSICKCGDFPRVTMKNNNDDEWIFSLTGLYHNNFKQYIVSPGTHFKVFIDGLIQNYCFSYFKG